ncbi:MAG: response regulator transcription factor [Chloroflexi bacterium]|nr:response regulator transcription factor [Chloroflexota bacterium]
MSKKTTVLVIDDDVRLLRFVRANLESVGYKVLMAEDAETGIGLVEKEMPDLIILDVMLPGLSGFELARRIREFSAVPILMLTAKAEEADVVAGLKVGADDYMTKPFGVQELLARVEAVLRRSGTPEGNTAPGQDGIKVGELSIDFLRRRVSVKGTEVELTLTEYKLLSELASNAGKVMLHSELLSKVWGPEYRNEWEYLRAYIRRLRRKLEQDPAHPQYILSRPGFGYVLAKPVLEPSVK